MVVGKTCSACRSRKVRCDGVGPVCGPCSKARQQLECVYTTGSSSPAAKGPLLQKGAACFPCRRKKKKCDAIRPFCTTCKVAGKEHDCQYEDNVERSLTEALIAHTRELEQRLALYESQPQGTSASASTSSTPYEQEAPTPAGEDTDMLSPVLPPFPAPFIQGTSLSDIPTFFLNQSPSRPSAVRNDGSSMAGTHYGPLSVRNGDDLRALFIAHHGQIGICVSQAKLEAIMIGDLSNRVAHPALIHVAQLLGFSLWQEQMKAVCDSSLSVEEYQHNLVRQALLGAVDPVTRLQVETMLAFYYFLRRRMPEGRDQLAQAARTATENNLTFNIPTEAPLQELSMEAKEQICALCQLMYLDKAATIVFNDPSLLSAQYEHEFRAVPYLFANLSSNNMVVLRTRSVSLLQRTRAMSAHWTELLLNQPYPSLAGHEQWYADYWNLMGEISEHLANLNPSMLKATFFRHREYGLTMKLCMIISLTASAELHRLLAGQHVESRLRCLDTVFEIVGITRSFQDDDYIFLDPILGICWTMVASVLDQERIISTDQFAIIHYKALFNVITTSASKLQRTLPFVDASVETIKNLASLSRNTP